MFRNKWMIPVMLVLFISSCVKKKLPASEYVNYIESEKNGLNVSKTIGDICYRVQYKPQDYILLKENKSDQSIVKKQDLKDMQYYTLQYALKEKNEDILKAHLNNSNEYYARSNYFSFDLQQDIYLVEGKDTLPCRLFNYVNSYGLSPKADFVLAFDKTANTAKEDKTIVIEDKVYGGGVIKLKIEKENIKDIPELIQ